MWRRPVALVAVVVWLGPAAPARAQGSAVGTARCAPGSVACSAVASDAFAVAWSSWDARSQRYVPLVYRRLLGLSKLVRTRLRGRRTPFDLDVVGGAVRVYSRCGGDPGGPSRGCAVYRRDGRRERQLGTLTSTRPLHPVLANRLAAVVADAGRPPRLVICSTFGRRCRTGPRLFAKRTRDARVTGMDASGRRLAIATSWRDARGLRSAIKLIRNVERPRSESLATGQGAQQVFSPSVNIGMVFFVRGTPGCRGGATTFVRRSPQSGIVLTAPAPLVSAMTFDARAVWYIRCPVPGAESADIATQHDPFMRPSAPPPRRNSPRPRRATCGC